MRKNVLIFIESLQCGGAEKSLISLLPFLDNTRMNIDLLLLKRGGIFEQYIPENIHIIDFRQQVSPWLFRIYQALFSLRLRWNCLIGKKEHGAETRWKVMQRAYTIMPKHYDVAIAYQQGFPTYYTIDKISADKKYTWINADITKVGYNAQFNRPFYDKADKIIPVSDRLRDILASSGYVPAGKLHPIYDIVNSRLIQVMAQKPQSDIFFNGLKLLTVGRMVHPKGFDLAVETAKILQSERIQFCWYFVGDGKELANIKRMINQYNLDKNVILLGARQNPYAYMAACDIYVQTSRYEGFGLTIAEAKVLHKPIVSTKYPVVYDQIKEGYNGLLAEMNAPSIAENILRLANNPDLQKTFTLNLQKEHNTTMEKESAKVISLINS